MMNIYMDTELIRRAVGFVVKLSFGNVPFGRAKRVCGRMERALRSKLAEPHDEDVCSKLAETIYSFSDSCRLLYHIL